MVGPSSVVRFARTQLELRSFFRDTISLDDARRTITHAVSRRDDNFIRMLEHNVYGYPASPYLPMLGRAGIELGDIRRELSQHGLEGTLHSLRLSGIYVTFEEMKGREPIVREGREIPLRGGFRNPRLSPVHQIESGGSTGTPMAIPSDLAFHAALSAYQLVAWEARGWTRLPWALWRGVLPDGSGLHNVMRAGHFGRPPERWFSPVISRDQPRSMWRYGLHTMTPIVMARSVGMKVPWPERVRLDQPDIVARWMGEALRDHGGCIMQAPVSRALRVALAAKDLSIDLTGANFRVAGEPLTPAKGNAIAASGATVTTSYGSSETGRVGFGCADPAEMNDVHFLDGQAALIQHDRTVPGTDIEVPAFLFTMLHPASPLVLINGESDDYGTVERRSCRCLLGELGLDTHLGEIRSFRKLTGGGMTLIGSDMVRILEEVLPARHGGSPLDYQLVEDEDEDGFTRFHIRVSPRLKIADDEAVARTFVEAIDSMGGLAGVSHQMRQGEMIAVDRTEPEWTGRGKLMSLHVTRRLGGAGS